MSTISIEVEDQLAEQLKIYASQNGKSVAELTTSVWQSWVTENQQAKVSDDTDEAVKQELERRWQAYENGEVKAVSFEDFKKEMKARLERHRAEKKLNA